MTKFDKIAITLFIPFVISLFSLIWHVHYVRNIEHLKLERQRIEKEEEAVKSLKDSHSYISINSTISLVWIENKVYKFESVRTGRYSHHLEVTVKE